MAPKQDYHVSFDLAALCGWRSYRKRSGAVQALGFQARVCSTCARRCRKRQHNIHKYADRFVDHVLFHKRHEAQAALRRFAHEAGFITGRFTVLERALSTVRASTGTHASFLVLDDGRPSIDENDPALLALRA
jgi:hypothetical protein